MPFYLVLVHVVFESHYTCKTPTISSTVLALSVFHTLIILSARLFGTCAGVSDNEPKDSVGEGDSGSEMAGLGSDLLPPARLLSRWNRAGRRHRGEAVRPVEEVCVIRARRNKVCLF